MSGEEGWKQNSSFSHSDGAKASPETRVGKLSPCGLQGMKTHTPVLRKRREAKRGKRKRKAGIEEQRRRRGAPILP